MIGDIMNEGTSEFILAFLIGMAVCFIVFKIYGILLFIGIFVTLLMTLRILHMRSRSKGLYVR